ncbi:hypothetical protein JTE90_009739 [Oedothorax gibbosus]|uniref:C2H2-type domain-containing protein n=1 Tax=Oedothorax gibbosus TaxID=931172 RepID=A0AAV6VAN6_9ARAC|nr:hypothetical protein JTE90_009739 [Oedothorax gibbosus]
MFRKQSAKPISHSNLPWEKKTLVAIKKWCALITSLTETTASPITITFIYSVSDPSTIPLYLRTGHEKKLCCNQEVVCPDDFTDRSHSKSHYNHVHMQCGRSSTIPLYLRMT